MNARLVLLAVLALAVLFAGQRRAPAPPGDTPKGPKTPEEIKAKLKRLHAEVKTRKLTFTVGHTRALEHRLAVLAGGRVPPDIARRAREQHKRSVALHKIIVEARDKYVRRTEVKLPYLHWLKIKPKAPPKHFDWAAKGKVTPVEDQGSCGSCWDFSAIGAFESSYLIHNGRTIDASEQQVLDCSKGGSCGGGWHGPVFDYLVHHGTSSAGAYRAYRHKQGDCNHKVATPLRAVNWGYVNPKVDIPSNSELKHALLEHGPLAVAVNATGLFQAYTGGVFNEHAKGDINHCVLLVGWDDGKKAWRIKNSWSARWGEKGYMWIAYGSNKIGYRAAWVHARNIHYSLPKSYFSHFKKEIKPFPKPVSFKP
jgi:cathepsin L